MRQRKIFIYTVMFMLGNFLTGAHEGCAPTNSGNIAEKQSTESWEIEYTMSGGFAGIMRQLKLSSNGRLLASDLKKKIHMEQQAPAEQVAEISDLLHKIDLSRASRSRFDLYKKCADCFERELTVITEGQRHKLYIDDTALEDQEYVRLIKLLSSLMDQAFVIEKP